jgi:hypothetical protein
MKSLEDSRRFGTLHGVKMGRIKNFAAAVLGVNGIFAVNSSSKQYSATGLILFVLALHNS